MHAAQGTVHSRDVVTAPPKGHHMRCVHQGWVLQGLERKASIRAADTQGQGPALGELCTDMLVHTYLPHTATTSTHTYPTPSLPPFSLNLIES